MKKLLLFIMMCLMGLSMQAQNSSGEYVDLGLPSGTLWKSANEKGGFVSWDEAMQRYGDKLPSMEQWEELKGMCKWEWTGKGYKVTGDNGNSIVLSASGYRGYGHVSAVGSLGCYWSSTLGSSGKVWVIWLDDDGPVVREQQLFYEAQFGFSVRLVQYE